MKVLVIGANGAVGQKVISKLKDTEHTSVAMVRKDEQVNELKNLGADEVVVHDIEENFSSAFKNVDGVIFTAGSGGNTGADKTILVDLWGAKKAVDFALDNRIEKFVQLSATDSPNPDIESDMMRPYAVAKHFSDYYIENSNLNYTILHPGPLQNSDGTGKIDASLEITNDPNSYTIPREDVAETLIQSLTEPAVNKKNVFIQSGNTIIKEALNNIR